MHWGKKLISLILTGCIAVSALPAVAVEAGNNPFKDVHEGSWYYNQVCSVYEKGLMAGVSDTRFEPDGTLSRAMVVQILYNYEGKPEVSGAAAFSDVTNGTWYYNAVQWAAKNHVVAGIGDGKFDPKGNVTREQMAVMLHSYAGKPAADGTLNFPDRGQVSSWAKNAVIWANQKQIINGSVQADKTVLLMPKDGATRAQAASMILKFLDVMNDVDKNPDDPDGAKVSFQDFYADTADVLVGTAETVTFYAEVESEQLISDDAITLRNQQSKVLARMHDDGENGDVQAGDGIFTAQLEIKPEKQDKQYYHASYYNEVHSTDFMISCYLELTDEQLTAGDVIMDGLHDISAKYVETGDDDADFALAKKSYQEMMDYLEQQKKAGKIDRYSAESDGIHFYTPYQLHYVIYYEALLTSKDAQTASVQNKQAATDSYVRDGYSEICTMQPFQWQHPDSHFNNAAFRIVDENLSYAWTQQLENKQVTVESMKTLGKYHIILINTHGGVNSICTGETPTDQSRRTYSQDMQAGRIYTATVSGDENKTQFYTVSHTFFSRYYRAGSMNNSMIYVGSCHGADSTELSSALRHGGAKAVMAFKNSVYTVYDQEMCEEIVKNLCNDSGGTYPTLDTAISKAKTTLGENDASKNNWLSKFVNWVGGRDPAELQLFGDGNFRLDSGYISGTAEKASTGEAVKPIVRTTPNGGIEIGTSDGTFSLRANQGTYDVSVFTYGYLGRTVKNVEVGRGVTTYLSKSRLLSINDKNTQVSGRITDAVTGEVISNAVIRVRRDHNNTSGAYVTSADGSTFTITADENGQFATTALPVGYYTLELTKDGYITQYADILVGIGDYNELTMSQVLRDDDYRIVLKWGNDPRDLDSHVVGTLSSGDMFHTYYSDKSQYDGDTEVCNLDLDDTDGNGPETITLKPTTIEPYYYYIYRYSGEGTLASSGAHIEVFRGEKRIKTMDVPADQGDGDYWNVFAIVNGTLVVKNTISSSADITYAATGTDRSKSVNGVSEDTLKAETENGKSNNR